MRQVESATEVHLVFDFMTEYRLFSSIFFLLKLNLYLSRCYNKSVDIAVNSIFFIFLNMLRGSSIFANFSILILCILWNHEPVNSVSVTEELLNQMNSMSSDEVSSSHFLRCSLLESRENDIWREWWWYLVFNLKSWFKDFFFRTIC